MRKRFAEAAAAEREEVAAALRRAGADHLVLSTEGDWLRDLAGHLRRCAGARRGAARAAPRAGGDGGHELPRAGPCCSGLLLLPLRRMRLRGHAAAPPRATRPRFGNPALLPGLVTARPGWRRHLPPLLLLVALGALVVALARPQRTVAAPQRQATVMMVTDVSGSMRANDVEPDRLSAAVEAGQTLADKLPDKLRLGLVSFSDYAEQTVPPTTDRGPVNDALDRLVADGGTAMGDALRRGIEAARTPVANRDGSGTRRLPARDRAALRRQEHVGQHAPARRRPPGQGAPHPDLRDRARHAERPHRADRPVLRHHADDRGAARPGHAEADRDDHRRALLRDRRRPPT